MAINNEISNFSKPNYECQHNTVYWERGDYLGLGISASSFIEGKRFTNPVSIEEYSNGTFFTPQYVSSLESIPLEEMFEETIFLA